MLENSTIEIGIRIFKSDTTEIIKNKVVLSDSFGCRHFQLVNPTINKYDVIKNIIDKHINDWYELSFYFAKPSNFEGLSMETIWGRIVSQTTIAKSKFLVLSPAYLTMILDTINIEDSIDINKKMEILINKIVKKNILLCLENGNIELNSYSIQYPPQAIAQDKTGLIKLAIDINKSISDNIEPLELISTYDKSIAMVFWSRSDLNIEDCKRDLNFLKLLVRLYSLPFKQRPLILTDVNISDLEKSLNKFQELVDSNRLYYL